MRTIQEHVPLHRHSSYNIGGPARFFAVVKTKAQALEAFAFARKQKLPSFILAGGTNILFDQDGYHGVIVKPAFDILCRRSKNVVRVGAGVPMRTLVDFATAQGLSGLEWAGGLPGTVGGAIRGNAGAFGGEMKDIILTVTSMNTKTGTVKERSAPQAKFGYRASLYKTEPGKELIIEAQLQLKPGNSQEIADAVHQKIAYRLHKHPMEHPNVGSIFKNVPVDMVDIKKLKRKFEKKGVELPVKDDPFPVVPSAFLISQTGLVGISCGGAMISPKHPNFIINACNATSGDVRELMNLVRGQVQSQFGVELEPEVIELSSSL